MKNPKVDPGAVLRSLVFNASSKLVGKFGDRYARVIQLKRRKKTAICGHCGQRCRGRYDKKVLRVRGPVGCRMANLPGVRTLACQMSEVLRRACRTS